LLTDDNDFPATMPRRALRSAMFRSGLTAQLGPRYWRPTDAAPYIKVLRCERVEMFGGMPIDFADPHYGAIIGPASARWSFHDEKITAIDDCWVEPNRCQIIGPDGRLVKQSVTHLYVPLYPSAIDFAMRGRGSPLDEAIVYDGFNSSNYYHHLIDTLPNIAMYQASSGLASIVSPKVEMPT